MEVLDFSNLNLVLVYEFIYTIIVEVRLHRADYEPLR